MKHDMHIPGVFLLLMLAVSAAAQTRISGSVLDERQQPIAGANVVIRNTYDGASTAPDGTFSFMTDERGQQTLDITFVGYHAATQAVELNGALVSIQVTLKEEINELNAVVISAGSFTAGEEKRRTILKAVDIATTAGATADIAGALNTLPGTQKNGESGRLFVRGGDGNEVRTFIDGMVVMDAYAPAAPNTPSRGRFLPFMFKGTSFSTGGYSAEYGQALSSALVLTSKDKAEFNQTDIGILSVGADVAHTQVWEKSSATIKLQRTDIRPYFNLINQRIDWKTPPVSTEGSGSYRYQVGKSGMIKVYGNFNQSDFSLYNHDIDNPTLRQLYVVKNRYAYGNASAQLTLGDRWGMRSGISFTSNGTEATLEGTPVGQTERGLHAKVVAEHDAAEWLDLRLGTELLYRQYDAHRWNTATQVNDQLNFTEAITASFAETELRLSKYFVSKAGARTEYNSLRSAWSVDPRISLAWKPGAKGQFSLAAGTFRQSARNEYLRLNTALGSEQALHLILNYQMVLDRRTFRVETYYKRYSDLTRFLGGDPARPVNTGSGYARGVELFWRDNQSIRNADYWVSYSYLDTERDYLNFPYAAVPSFASKHNFSLVYKHFVTSLKSQLGFTWSYSSPRTYNNPNLDRFNAGQTPSYQDLSANVSYLPRNWLIIYASCSNLLGRDNIFGYQYSTVQNASGQYNGVPTRQAANRFLFLGVFITLSKSKSVNQLPNL